MALTPRFRPDPSHRPRATSAPGGAFRVRWLGAAGHVVSAGNTTVLIDPFLSRPSLWHTATRRLRPTPHAWWHWLPDRIDAICLGHSHYDHLMDAPIIARRTGASIIGSETTAAFARASGVPEGQIITVPPGGRTLTVGNVILRFVPSLHARILAGRVPLEGMVTEPPRLPARVFRYRVGGAFGIHLTAGGRTLYHNGSADLIDAALEGLEADVLLVGLAGRQATRDYLARLTGLLSPALIVPTHHDSFFAPLEAGVRLLPRVDLGGFLTEARRLRPGARAVTPLYEDWLSVPSDGSAADAMFAPG